MDGPRDDIPLDDAAGAVCPSCGRDLTGLPPGSNCPECDSQVVAGHAAPEGHLAPGSVCPRCGYDMEGLPAGGRCPECNAPAFLASDPFRFRNGPLALIRKQARAAGRIYWSVIIITLSFVLGYGALITAFLLAGLMSGMNQPGATPQFSVPAMILIGVGSVFLIGGTMAGYAFFYINWWRLTARQPGVAAPSSRVWTRVGVVSMLAPILFLPASFFLTVLTPGRLVGVMSVLGMLAAYALAFFGIAAFFFGSLAFLRWLMRRVPDEKTRGFIGTCMWVIPLVSIVGSCVLYLGTLAGIVLYLIAMRRVHRALAAEVRAAEAAEVPV